MPSPAERYAAARRPGFGSPELTRFAAALDFELDGFQVEACEALESGRGVLVAAPTGSGKTVVGEFAVHLALARGQKAFYTTPIKALSNQKYHELAARHGYDRVGLLTGDVSVNGEAPVVVGARSALFLPFPVTLIPMFDLWARLGMVNTLFPLIIPAAFSAYGTFLLRQFMLTIPSSLDEAAAIDGAGHWRIFTQVILPLARLQSVRISQGPVDRALRVANLTGHTVLGQVSGTLGIVDRDDAYAVLADLTRDVLAESEASQTTQERWQQWAQRHSLAVERARAAVTGVQNSAARLAPMSVALRTMRSLTRAAAGERG